MRGEEGEETGSADTDYRQGLPSSSLGCSEENNLARPSEGPYYLFFFLSVIPLSITLMSGVILAYIEAGESAISKPKSL